jgi:hypothetical protein
MDAVRAAASPSMGERIRARLTAGNLLIGIALVAMLAVAIRRGGDADFFAHIKTAQIIVDSRGLPGHDVFSYTVNNRVWVDHEYMTELVMYGLLNYLGGFAAVSIGFGVLVTVGFLLMLARINLRPAPHIVVAAALGLGALAGIALWGPRAQMVTFTLVALTLYLIDLYLQRRSRAIYLLPVVVAVWANFHAGFVYAFLLLALTASCELVLWAIDRNRREHLAAARQLAIVLGVSAVAGLLTPWGPSLYHYIWLTQTSGTLSNFTAEWLSPDFHHLNMVAFLLTILIFGAGLVFYRPRLHQIVIAVVTLGLALQSQRNILLFIAAATPVIAWCYGAAWNEYEVGRRLQEWLRPRPKDLLLVATAGFAVAVIAVAAFVADGLGKQASSTRANFPAAASDWLAARPDTGSRMFSDVGWSGYLNYRFYPQQNRSVFMLGDPTLVGDALMRQYTDITTLSSDWHTLLDRYRVDYVVFEPNTALASALDASPGWHRAYSDSVAVIWLRGSA